MPNLLDAPIPGQSLTRPPKSSPMEQPPRFVEREELQDFFFERLTEGKGAKRIIMLLKAGASAESIARTLLYTGVIEGLYTPDLMLLTAKDVYYLILAVAKVAGVENVQAKNPDRGYEEFLDSILPALEEEQANRVIDTPEEEAAMSIFAGLGEMEEEDDDEGGIFNLGDDD